MNIYNYNKNNNIYSTYNNLFNIHTINNNNIYNTNNTIFYMNNIFDMNTLNYKRNNNIYNTHYYIKKTDVGLGMDASRSNMLLPPKKNHIVDLNDKIKINNYYIII